MDSVALTLRLPAEIHERLRREAFDQRVSITSLIIEALAEPPTSEPEWEYGTALLSEAGEIWDEWSSTKEIAERDLAQDNPADHAPDRLVMVRRIPARPAGPWEPVTETQGDK